MAAIYKEILKENIFREDCKKKIKGPVGFETRSLGSEPEAEPLELNLSAIVRAAFLGKDSGPVSDRNNPHHRKFHTTSKLNENVKKKISNFQTNVSGWFSTVLNSY